MSNYEVLDPEWFPDSDAERDVLYEQHLLGSRATNWAFLVNVARANLEYGTIGTSAVLRTWAKQREEGRDKVGIEQLLLLRYKLEIGGPVFGAVISTAFAIESFAWLAGLTLLDDEERDHELTLEKFESATAERRVKYVLKMTSARLSKRTQERLQALICFRNDMAHDSTILFAEDGLVRRSHGKDRHYDPSQRYGDWLPSMHDNPVPLDLAHAVEATKLHDAIVTTVTDMDSRLKDSLRKIEPEIFWRILGGLGRMKVADAVRMANGWTKDFLPWRAEITNKEREAWYRGRVRRGTIKPVD